MRQAAVEVVTLVVKEVEVVLLAVEVVLAVEVWEVVRVVKEEVVIGDVETGVLVEGVTELLVPVAELVDAEVGAVVPLDDGAETE